MHQSYSLDHDLSVYRTYNHTQIFSVYDYMSYLRLDNYSYSPTLSTLMTADGQTAQPQSMSMSMQQRPMQQRQQRQQLRPIQQYQQHQLRQQRQRQPMQQQPPPQQQYHIKGIDKLITAIGYPDITDPSEGGIAIWSAHTLKARGYKFLYRVEIIDESIPCLKPIEHFGNIYIWVNMNLSKNEICNVESLSTNIYYDQGKELLIVRSNTLDTAVAQAALVALYSIGKLTFYDIVNNDMHYTYYANAGLPKVKKTLYTVLNRLFTSKHNSKSRIGRNKS